MSRATLFACFSALLLALGGCASTQEAPEPSALQAIQEAGQESGVLNIPEAEAGAQTPPAATPPQESAPAPVTQAAAAAGPVRLHFAPVIGATAQASASLTARLNAGAGQRGLNLVTADDRSLTHSVRGYFSAISENGQTTVIFVWDVIDPGGNRVHRIQGRQSARSDADEGWSSVDSATMEAIADRTVEQLASWAVSGSG